MPKTIINYTNAVIYKIQHHEKLELVYVGSTTDFTRRKAEHKRRCHNSNDKNHDAKIYRMIRDNGGWDDFKMIIIKEFPCDSKIELLIEEDLMMMELKSSLNSCKSYCTEDKYRNANREARDRKYREKIKAGVLTERQQNINILDKYSLLF